MRRGPRREGSLSAPSESVIERAAVKRGERSPSAEGGEAETGPARRGAGEGVRGGESQATDFSTEFLATDFYANLTALYIRYGCLNIFF